MSQRKEKYARRIERRVDKLEESRDRIGERLGEYGYRLTKMEIDIVRHKDIYGNEIKKKRRRLREIERGVAVALLLEVLLAAALLIVAVNVG